MHTDVQNVLYLLSSMRDEFNHHGPRVSVNAIKLSEARGLQAYEVGLIAAGSQLHDIGKLLIRSEILNAPRKLTVDEFTEMQRHAIMGWDIVNKAGYEKTIQDIVRHHHERWDGTGYPDGLKEEDIPLAARIISVCDVYQAMTAERIYRKPLTHKFVKDFMLSSKGVILDPTLVDLFFEKVVTE